METLVELLRPFRLAARVKWTGDDEPSEWSWPLYSPVPGYIETGRLGPVAVRDVEWIEIDAIEKKHVGQLIKVQLIDHSNEMTALLENAMLTFHRYGNVFRIIAA